MRNIPHVLDPEVVSGIDGHLEQARSQHGVTIPWAIESGSRAWGFPSPDSDYDCRFIFLRPRDHYLTLWPRRDVIEIPIDPVFDVNGWDLAKALRLLVKGNATVTEWLHSPIIYSGDRRFRDSLLELAGEVLRRDLVGRHYFHVGRQQLPGGENEVSLKKVLYSLRPAAALRWLRVHPGQAVPPMNLQDLMSECDPPSDVVEETHRIVALKSVTRETGSGVFPPALAQFIAAEFEVAEVMYEGVDPTPHPGRTELVDQFFRSTLDQLDLE
jgi:predicted nucleotidyltransferase